MSDPRVDDLWNHHVNEQKLRHDMARHSQASDWSGSPHQQLLKRIADLEAQVSYLMRAEAELRAQIRKR